MNHRQALESIKKKLESDAYRPDVSQELAILKDLFDEYGITLYDNPPDIFFGRDFRAIESIKEKIDKDWDGENNFEISVEYSEYHDDCYYYYIASDIVDAEDPVKAAKISHANQNIYTYGRRQAAAEVEVKKYSELLEAEFEKLNKLIGKNK
jgi:hypothetical protein